MIRVPRMKRELAVIQAVNAAGGVIRSIWFDATPDAAEDMRQFGVLLSHGNRYNLLVDARYDFDEVVAYMESYGS